MINGTVDIANSSRAMRESEYEASRARDSTARVRSRVRCACFIFLHPDNPLTSISIEQLVGVYGEFGEIESWSQLGVSVPGCGSDEIVRVSRRIIRERMRISARQFKGVGQARLS